MKITIVFIVTFVIVFCINKFFTKFLAWLKDDIHSKIKTLDNLNIDNIENHSLSCFLRSFIDSMSISECFEFLKYINVIISFGGNNNTNFDILNKNTKKIIHNLISHHIKLVIKTNKYDKDKLMKDLVEIMCSDKSWK